MQTMPLLTSMTLVILTMKLYSVLPMPQTVVGTIMGIKESGICRVECQLMIAMTLTLAETEVLVYYALHGMVAHLCS